MPNRTAPYPSYNYLVDLKGPRDPEKPLGGFSDLAGMKTELHIAEYRDGNDSANFVHKYCGLHTSGDVTLKRGVVDTSDLWDWITDARTNGSSAQRDVTITLRDEANNPVQVFKLYAVTPKGYTGPTLTGKSGEIAIEELVLAPETIEITQPS
ncbi:MAG: phage tail protein [Terracidiphilus sp.]|jgi:phage tail-like protein